MSNKFILIIIVLILAFGCILHARYIENSSSKLLETVDRLEQLIYQEDYEMALGSLDKLNTDWQKYIRVYSVLFEHSEIDEIHVEIENLYADLYLRSENALGDVKRLRYNITHISVGERFRIENIF